MPLKTTDEHIIAGKGTVIFKVPNLQDDETVEIEVTAAKAPSNVKFHRDLCWSGEPRDPGYYIDAEDNWEEIAHPFSCHTQGLDEFIYFTTFTAAKRCATELLMERMHVIRDQYNTLRKLRRKDLGM